MYTVEDTSRIAEDARRAGAPDPRFGTIEEAIWYSVRDLSSWTDGSGHYVIRQDQPTTDLTPTDLVTIVGFVCCDRTRDHGTLVYRDGDEIVRRFSRDHDFEIVYLGVDGTVRRFYRDHDVETGEESIFEVVINLRRGRFRSAE